jgi:hypothetical protein
MPGRWTSLVTEPARWAPLVIVLPTDEFLPLLTVQRCTPRLTSLYDCLCALTLFGYFYNCPYFPFPAHLRRVPGRLHWSYTALLPCLVDVEKLRGKEGELWLLMLVGKGSFHLRLLRCLASRGKLGVAGFCSVMLGMSSWSSGPGSGRAGIHVHQPLQDFCTFSNYLLTLWQRWTLCLTELSCSYTYVNLNLVRLITPEIVPYRSGAVFASELAESWMKTPVWRMNSLESWGPRTTASKRSPLLQTCTIV